MKKEYKVGDVFVSDGKYREVLEVTPLGYNTVIVDGPKKSKSKGKSAQDDPPEEVTTDE